MVIMYIYSFIYIYTGRHLDGVALGDEVADVGDEEGEAHGAAQGQRRRDAALRLPPPPPPPPLPLACLCPR